MQQDVAAKRAQRGDRRSGGVTIGIDIGDTYSSICVLDEEGTIAEESRTRTTTAALARQFSPLTPCRVVLEVSTHSPWVSRLLSGFGHEVIVANPRRVRLIAESDRKHDRTDAEQLARLGRIDPDLLNPIRHRSQQAQEDLEVIRGRAALVRARTMLINHARGAAKATGSRLPSCSSYAFPRRVVSDVPEGLTRALLPMLDAIAELNREISRMEREVENAIVDRHSQARLLQQVQGVGPLTALTYVLTLEDPERFRSSRQVGPYLGLTPRQRQSGNQAPQLPVSKAGDPFLRQLLVGCAHYILGPFGPDTDLRRWGLQHGASGKGNAKKRAVVAVARKLAVLLHRLWVSGEVYEPLRCRKEVVVAVS